MLFDDTSFTIVLSLNCPHSRHITGHMWLCCWPRCYVEPTPEVVNKWSIGHSTFFEKSKIWWGWWARTEITACLTTTASLVTTLSILPRCLIDSIFSSSGWTSQRPLVKAAAFVMFLHSFINSFPLFFPLICHLSLFPVGSLQRAKSFVQESFFESMPEWHLLHRRIMRLFEQIHRAMTVLNRLFCLFVRFFAKQTHPNEPFPLVQVCSSGLSAVVCLSALSFCIWTQRRQKTPGEVFDQTSTLPLWFSEPGLVCWGLLYKNKDLQKTLEGSLPSWLFVWLLQMRAL